MTEMIHAVASGDVAFLAHRLDTGEQAVIITTGTTDRDRIADHFRSRMVEGSGEYDRPRRERKASA